MNLLIDRNREKVRGFTIFEIESSKQVKDYIESCKIYKNHGLLPVPKDQRVRKESKVLKEQPAHRESKVLQGPVGPSVPSVKFLAEKSLGKTYTTSTPIQVTYKNIIFNQGGGYSPFTSKYIAPIDGVYLFVASVEFNPLMGFTADVRLFLRKNLVPIAGITELDNVTTTPKIMITTIINLVARDQNVTFNSSQNGFLAAPSPTIFFAGSILP
jgi:hypothetical protein